MQNHPAPPPRGIPDMASFGDMLPLCAGKASRRGGCHCSRSLLFFHCNQPSDRKTKGKGVYLGSQFQKVPLMATWFCATCLTMRLTIMAGGACDQGHFFHLHEKRKPRARQEESRSMRRARTHLQRLLASPRFYLLEFLEPSKTAVLARNQTSNR